MGLFRRGPKKIGGYEIEKTVKCARCGQKMHIPKEWLPVTPDTISIGIAYGSQCRACSKYFCIMCRHDLDMGRFRCCPLVGREGVYKIQYFEG